MPRFVLDASMALSWYFRDEKSDVSELALAMTDNHQLLVPPHWFSEVANGIRQGERRGRCDVDYAPIFVTQLASMNFAINQLAPFDQFETILPLARIHQLTVYDAIYLHLAMIGMESLATLDKGLARAARSLGLTVVGD